MRRASRESGLIVLAAILLGQWLVGVDPAAAHRIPFALTNEPYAFKRIVKCWGPWIRDFTYNVPPHSEADEVEIYSVESTDFFSPVNGRWDCELEIIDAEGYITYRSTNFCLSGNATLVEIIPVRDEMITIATDRCQVQSRPPPPLREIAGTAEGVGSSGGQSSISLSGTFVHDSPLLLDQATVSLSGLLNEVDGAGELLDGLPVVLSPAADATSDAATFESPAGTEPQVTMDMLSTGTFDLFIDGAAIPNFPQNCSDAAPSTTALALRMAIDDDANPVLRLESPVQWECLGNDPQMPVSLEALAVLPLSQRPPTPTAAPDPSGSGEDDGCQLQSQSESGIGAALLLPLALLILRRRTAVR